MLFQLVFKNLSRESNFDFKANITDMTTYSKYIQLVTANCIDDNDFLAGNMKWEVSIFNPIIHKY